MGRLFLILFVFFCSVCCSAQYTVSGGIGTPYIYTDDLSGTGIEKVYLLNTLNNAQISYTSSATSVQFYRYRYSLSDKELIPASEISTTSTGGSTTYIISNLRDSYGYFVEENGGVKAAIWIIDYNTHQPVLNSISIIEGDDRCELLKLFVSKSDELSFYANNGSKRDIKRIYKITYENYKWNGDSHSFETETVSMQDEIGTDVIIEAPLKDTYFTLKGDQFAEHFGITKEIVSSEYNAVAVEGHIITEQTKRNNPNEKEDKNTELGGSAPVTIDFYGYGNEPVAAYYTWLIYNRQDQNNPIARYTDRDINYTFNQSGDYIVKLELANSSSTCIDTVSVSFKVTESFLEIPNFFSPGDSPGVNDEFRVAYRSLIKFKCTIFNRWGVKLYEFNDPAKGWDGKYKGKYVNTGVYYYVIEALGSDGIRYKEGGDINIVKSR